MTAYDWLPPSLWTCVRCAATILTREAGPRCPRCGFVEGS